MKIEVTCDDKKIPLNIGPSLMVTASEKLREAKKQNFEFAIGQIGKSDVTGEKASPVILTALGDFLGSQTVPDSEVAQWIRTWEGRLFTVEHAQKRFSRDTSVLITREDAESLLDGVSAEDYRQITFAVDCLIEGEKRASLFRAQIDADNELQQARIERQKVQVQTEQFKLQREQMEFAQLQAPEEA